MKRHTHIRWLAPAMLGLLLATPALSWAQDDLDVTMRMVADDQELDDSFVQQLELPESCLLYTSPSPRDRQKSRMPSSA